MYTFGFAFIQSYTIIHKQQKLKLIVLCNNYNYHVIGHYMQIYV